MGLTCGCHAQLTHTAGALLPRSAPSRTVAGPANYDNDLSPKTKITVDTCSLL